MENRRVVADTTIFIEHLRATKKEKTKLFKLVNEVELYTSAITVYKLLMGAKTEQKKQDVFLLVEDIPILPFDYEASLKAAEIFHYLRTSNKLIEFRDIFIGAICLANNLPVATINRKHFERIKGLELY
ncbi:MAG: type II toxin-antitoxin system VapC family toxin [Bacteroidota bacterium]